MTKSLIPESKDKSYTEEQALISDFAQQTGIDYEVPNALDAAICVFMQYIRTKEHLFQWTPTRCQEKISIQNKLNFQVRVRGVPGTNVEVSFCSSEARESFGIAALRKFF